MDTVARIAGFFWMDEAGHGADDRGRDADQPRRPHYFDKQSAVWPAPPERRLPSYQISVLPSLRGASPALEARVVPEQQVALLLSRWGFFQSRPDLMEAYCLMPDNGNVRYFVDRAFAEEPPDHDTFCREQAIARCRMMLAHRGDDWVTLNELADLLGEAGQLDEALELAGRAKALAPSDGMVADTYGWILYRARRTKEAVAALQHAATLRPDHPVILYHLGAACAAAGNRDAARRHLERALALSPDFPGREDAQRLLAAR